MECTETPAPNYPRICFECRFLWEDTNPFSTIYRCTGVKPELDFVTGETVTPTPLCEVRNIDGRCPGWAPKEKEE